jgi:hypothetical protein
VTAPTSRFVRSPIDAADLLHAGHCTPQCLLAMATPEGWAGCACPCDGRYHAALTFAPVLPVPEIRDADGTDLGVRPSLRVAS